MKTTKEIIRETLNEAWNNLINNHKLSEKTLRQIYPEIQVGDVYKLYGIITKAFKDYPLNDERVEVMEKEDNGVLTLKVIDPMKFGPVVTGRDWEYRKGSRMYISIKDDGDRIYLTPVKKEDVTENINEAEYKGRKVTLNKPFYTPDGPKKRSVYVKNDKGNVVKVNFGDPDMEIKRDDPERRKSFRARHGCDQKKDKTTPGYWSCRSW